MLRRASFFLSTRTHRMRYRARSFRRVGRFVEEAFFVKGYEDTALRLGQALGITPEFWLNLQNLYDLDLARASIDIGTIESLSVAP